MVVVPSYCTVGMLFLLIGFMTDPGHTNCRRLWWLGTSDGDSAN
jgi:hypothetical protein